jgi:sulfur carrier protein ThiS
MIYVKVYSDLNKYLNLKKIGETINFDNKSSKIQIAELIKRLNIPENEVSIILVNGNHKCFEEYVEDGDNVVLFSPIEGG